MKVIHLESNEKKNLEKDLKTLKQGLMKGSRKCIV